MQGAIAQVCMVLVATILNHPTLLPQEDATLPEQDEELMARMREHEERLVMEQARLEEELSQLDSKQEETSLEDDYGWYFWCTLSHVIFIIVAVLWVALADAGGRPIEDEDIFSERGSIGSRALVLDKDILINFCDRCSYTSALEKWRVREFAEGFAGDLLELLWSVSNRGADMEVGSFVGFGSMFESWKVIKPLMCDLIVPFSPPEPYSFQFNLWCSPSSDVPPGMQGCGTIKVIRFWEEEEGCVCGSAKLGEDMLCLVHGNLTKDKVRKWFQISLTKVWSCISHKYEFDVTFRNLDAAGVLKIRFCSGKVFVMKIIPVAQLKDADVYFVPHVT